MTEPVVDDPVDAGVAAASPATVLLADDAGREVTGRELEATVADRAGALQAAGVSAGDRVAIIEADRIEAVLGILAIIRTDAVAVVIDADAPPADQRRRLEVAAVDHVVGTPPPGIEAVATSDPTATAVEAAMQPAETLRTVLFTSGTTGEAMPVGHTAGTHAAASKVAAEGLDLTAADRWYVPLGVHHMGGLAPVIRCLPLGIPVVLSETVGPRALLARIDRTDATLASVVPTMVQRALEGTPTVPDKLRCLLVGGAPLRQGLFDRAHAVGLPVYASYGLTETVGQVATATPDERAAHPDTVGRPLPGLDIAIVDDEGEPVDDGTTGTVVVTGPTVSPTRGEAVAGGHRLETRDIGHVDDAGRLWIHGRRDSAIITGGEVVHPQRVEAVVAAHPAVDDAGVVGVADPTWGERVVAAVVAEGVDADALLTWCRDRLTAAEVPRAVAFVDTLPYTASGTIDRPALRDRLEDA